MKHIRRISVFCGSSPGRSPRYGDTARALGELFVRENIELVYGGASVGLMGIVATSVLAAGGKVVGVIPKVLKVKEIAFEGAHELHVVDNMHARKALMYELSDGFMVLPGGLGTLDELFEIWTWSQLGLHKKPIGLIQVNHYFEGLVAFVKHATEEGFVRPEFAQTLLMSPDPGELLQKFRAYSPPPAPHWIGPKDV